MPTAGYERQDFSLRSIVGFGVVLILLLAMSMATMALMLPRITPVGRPTPAPKPPTAAIAEFAGIPRPADPRAALVELRAEEDRILKNYEWVSKENGIVRIPIEDAMEAIVNEGLPVRDAARLPESKNGNDE